MSPRKAQSPRAGTKRQALQQVPTTGQGCLLLIGLLIFCSGWLTIEAGIEAFAIWKAREGYAQAELEILSATRGKRDVRGRVMPAEVEVSINSSDFPDMMESSNGIVFTRKSEATLRGQQIPVWWHPGNRNVLYDLRVRSRHSGAKLRDGKAAFWTALVPCGLFLASAMLIRFAIAGRKSRPRT